MYRKLENFSTEELCDIYCNLENNEWDRRLGSKPRNFDSLPNCKHSRSFLKRYLRAKTKDDLLKPYKEQIESMTTPYDRKKYQYVTLWKIKSTVEFDEWWNGLLSNGYNQGDYSHNNCKEIH